MRYNLKAGVKNDNLKFLISSFSVKHVHGKAKEKFVCILREEY